jgi:hypothetical protein
LSIFSENQRGESFFSFFMGLKGDLHREVWPGIYTRQSSSEKGSCFGGYEFLVV